jgi:hypothetical protein
MHGDFSIEINGYQVQLEQSEGWRCQCGEFERSNVCEHTLLCAALSKIEGKLAESAKSSDIQYLASRRYVYRS